MTREQAERLGIGTIADLAEHAETLSIGGDYEFFERPEWFKVRDSYGLNFSEIRSFDSTFMYEAVATGEVDVISAFSSDGRIAAYDLVVLEDPRQAFPPYDAVLMLSPEASRDRRVVAALQPMIGAIPVDRMRQANQAVDTEGQTPAQAAEQLGDTIDRPSRDAQ